MHIRVVAHIDQLACKGYINDLCAVALLYFENEPACPEGLSQACRVNMHVLDA